MPAGTATRYVTQMVLGDDTVRGRLILNRMARTKAFPQWKLAPWIKHHVEEIGNLENFLPDLYHERVEFEP